MVLADPATSMAAPLILAAALPARARFVASTFVSVPSTFTDVDFIAIDADSRFSVLPPTVIARAKSVLAKLEAQDRGQTARALADDLPLFAVPSRAAAEPAPPSEAEKLIEALKAMHPDEMSPRDALEALYALKAKLPNR